MKLLHLFLPVLCWLILLSGCTPSRSVGPLADAYVEVSDGPAYARPNSPALQEDRKRIFSANLGLTVAEPDSATAQILAIAETAGGFMSESSTTRTTIRVPAPQMEEVMTRLQGLGKTRYKNLRGEDVTEAYRDFGIRLDNAEKSRQRYLELLAKAVSVEETLLVERELERLTETIDLLKGKMNRLDQLEAYATISVDLQQKAKLGPLGYVFKGLYSGVKWLFVRK